MSTRHSSPAGAVNYPVTYSSTGGASWKLAASAHTETSITINVANGSTYLVGLLVAYAVVVGGAALR